MILEMVMPRRRRTEQRASGSYNAIFEWFESLGIGRGNVTPESALRVAAVYAAVRVLSETVASLPLIVYRRLPNGGKERATNHPLYRVLHDQPNQWQTSFEFREMMMAHLALRGNAYARIMPGARGAVDQLIPLHPGRMRVERLENGRLLYTLSNQETGTETKYSQDEIFHLRGLSSDGITGLSPIAMAAKAINIACAAETHGESFFENGARPGVVLEHPTAISEPAAKRLRESWERMHGGAENAYKTAVLEEGLKAHEISLSNQDSQFIELRKMQIEEIARIFRVPPHMIGDLSRSTNNNIEQQSLEFVQYTMLPWFRRWESAIARDLIADDENYFAEFLVDGLMRGDAAARSSFYMAMMDRGVLSVNEVRSLENMNPIGPDGDKRLVQLNMTTLEKAGEEPMEPASQAEVDTEIEDDEDEADEERENPLITVVGALIAKLPSSGELAALSAKNGELGQRASALAAERDALTERIEQRTSELDAIKERMAQVEADAAVSAEVKAHELSGLRAQLDETASELATASALLDAHRVSGAQAAAAIRSMFVDLLERRIALETKRVLAAAKKPNEFLSEVDAFYEEHRVQLTSTLEPVFEIHRLLTGHKTDAASVAESHVTESRTAILTAAECSASELVHSVEECVKHWDKRAKAVADAIFNQEG